MIIKSTSKEMNETVCKIRDLMQPMVSERIYVVTHGIEGCFITIDSKTDDLVVYSSSDSEDLDVARGFDEIEDCWKYAKVIVSEAGLTDDDIDADIFEAD